MNTYKKSMFTLTVEDREPKPARIYLFNTLNGALARIEDEDWPGIPDGPFAIDGRDDFRALVEQGFAVPAETDERAVFKLWRAQHVHDCSTIKSKILVTRWCNLGCVYCILDHEPTVMTPETALAMDRFYIELIREKGPARVEDNYLGGEPFLNEKVIVESASRRFYFCRGKEIDYRFSVTTNGTLVSPDIVRRLVDAGLRSIRVSLAGPGEIHDRLRPFKSGKGSYSVILENLKRISGLVPIGVECQYDAASQDYRRIFEMVDQLIEQCVQLENIAFTPILPRRTNNRLDAGFSNPEIQLELYRQAALRGFPVFENPPGASCMADFRAQLVFDADGSIIPCPSLQGGEMALGHVERGVDFIEESQRLERKLPEECFSCELLPLCQGGCRLQALTKGGDFDGVDCNRKALALHVEEYVRRKGGGAGLKGP